MDTLDAYFKLFDEARYSETSFDALVALFSENVTFVLNGHAYHGKDAWVNFVKKVFEMNEDLKHMSNGWYQKDDGSYEAEWAICGKRYATGVYTQEGIDIAKLDKDNKISYLENKPYDANLFSSI